jgi:formylglycine-generating enzyme required for sulfatase activity
VRAIAPSETPLRTNLRQILGTIAQRASRLNPGCPPDMARIGTVCVDRFEAHVVEQVGGVERVHPYNRPLCRDEENVGPGAMRRRRAEAACEDRLKRIKARSSPDVFPQGYISQVQAQRACVNAGKRLCTSAEWKSGCVGRGKTPLPYGTRLIRGACNNGKPHVLSMLHGASPDGWSWAAFNDERLNAKEGFLEKTGKLMNCVSDYGLFDMVGNLQEWVADRVRTGSNPGRGVFLGSHFGNQGDESGFGCDYQIRAHDPSYHDYSIGFRCCRNVQ